MTREARRMLMEGLAILVMGSVFSAGEIAPASGEPVLGGWAFRHDAVAQNSGVAKPKTKTREEDKTEANGPDPQRCHLASSAR